MEDACSICSCTRADAVREECQNGLITRSSCRPAGTDHLHAPAFSAQGPGRSADPFARAAGTSIAASDACIGQPPRACRDLQGVLAGSQAWLGVVRHGVAGATSKQRQRRGTPSALEPRWLCCFPGPVEKAASCSYAGCIKAETEESITQAPEDKAVGKHLLLPRA